MASLIIGISTRLEMKPGASLHSSAVLPNCSQSVRVRSYVSSEVAMPRMTSTSFITGTGFMKCMPMTLSGRRVAAPSFVIEMDDVFDARIASGVVISSSARKICAFNPASSLTASITKRASLRSFNSLVGRMRSMIARFSSSASRALSTSRCKLRSIAARPRCKNSSATSRMTTP